MPFIYKYETLMFYWAISMLAGIFLIKWFSIQKILKEYNLRLKTLQYKIMWSAKPYSKNQIFT